MNYTCLRWDDEHGDPCTNVDCQSWHYRWLNVWESIGFAVWSDMLENNNAQALAQGIGWIKEVHKYPKTVQLGEAEFRICAVLASNKAAEEATHEDRVAALKITKAIALAVHLPVKWLLPENSPLLKMLDEEPNK